MKKDAIIQRVVGVSCVIVLVLGMLITNVQSVSAAQKDDFNLEA